MRVAKWMTIPALGAALLLPACGPGYMSTGVGVEAQYGTGIDLYGYDAGRYGDWHANYRQWSPTTVYELNGTYYPKNVRGGRQVQVYHSQATAVTGETREERRATSLVSRYCHSSGNSASSAKSVR